MPARKYRSVAKVPPPPTFPPLDPRNLNLVCDLSTTAACRTAPPTGPRPIG
jgi:hypothetical protein